jgi:hypothetical protein
MSSKAREALNQLLGLIDNEILVFNESLEPSEISQAQYHIDKAGEAYEEPLRNCDVGTAREQNLRFENFCYRHRSYEKGCGDCPLLDCEPCCELAWAHLPYGKEVQNG